MVTAETAVALPALVLVLALCLGGVQLGVDRLRCADAVRAGARAAARGDQESTVRALTLERMPAGAEVAFAHDGDTVTVSGAAPAPSALRLLGVPGCVESATSPAEALTGSGGQSP